MRCLFEDREGDLWVGSNNGLTQFRDDVFTVYGKSEGFPSDEPNVAFQDRDGRIWVGFHDAGLLMISGGERKLFTTRDGLPNNEVFSIREDARRRPADWHARRIVALHDGASASSCRTTRWRAVPIFDALEDSAGRVWLAPAARPAAITQATDCTRHFRAAAADDSVVTLCEGRGGVFWAGTYGKGLWRIDGDSRKLYTTADGLSSDQIRSLYQDADGTLWIATFGGGLDALARRTLLRVHGKRRPAER